MPKPDKRPKPINVSVFVDDRGSLGVLDQPLLPFDVKRLYFLYDLKASVMRGRHAHKTLEQVMICLHGSVDVSIWDGTNWEIHRLADRSQGLYFPPGYWREIVPIEDQSVVAVLASQEYDHDDYIMRKNEYLAYLEES